MGHFVRHLGVFDRAFRAAGPSGPNASRLSSNRDVIIIVRPEEMTVGFLVEAVSDILTVNNEEMTPTPDVNSAETKSFIEGIFTHGDQLIRAVDVRSIMPTGAEVHPQ